MMPNAIQLHALAVTIHLSQLIALHSLEIGPGSGSLIVADQISVRVSKCSDQISARAPIAGSFVRFTNYK